jgi:hypothetical protein
MSVVVAIAVGSTATLGLSALFTTLALNAVPRRR